MTVKLAEIGCCYDCPHRQHMGFLSQQCTIDYPKHRKVYKVIPEWCPLPDRPKEDSST